MVRKIGKAFIFILLMVNCVSKSNGASITLTINDMNGKSVRELKRGAPYLLEISVEGDHRMQDVEITGLNNVYYEFRGSSRITMMSKVTSQHTYLIRPNTVGVFTFGPVTLKRHDGSELCSEALSYSVVEDHQKDVIVELLSSADRIVPGEKCILTIRLNTRVPTELISLEHPNLDATLGTISSLNQTKRGTRVINNVNYEFAEWQAELTVKKTGKLSIPPFKAICKTLQKHTRSHDLFSVLMSRFNAHTNPQHYLSNDLQIFVDPLPYCDKEIHGMGVFSDFKATWQCDKAHVGEGIVLTLAVNSKKDPYEVKPPKLQLPENLKYYESKTMIDEGDLQTPYRISFEYIVQGMKEGTYEITQQFFTFFNTEKRCYETLETQKTSFRVLPPSVMHTHSKDYETDDRAHEEDDIHPIRENGAWLFQSERSLSWQWFLIIALLPLLYLLRILGTEYYQNYYNMHKKYLDKKYAFSIARKRLLKTVQNNISNQLYDIFMNLFANRLGLLPGELTAEKIEEILQERGFSKDALEQWQRFFYSLQESAFIKKNSRIHEQELVKRAHVWLKQLEEKI